MRRILIFAQFILILLLTFACDPETLFRNSPNVEAFSVSPSQLNPFDTVYADVSAINPEEGTLSYQWSVSPEAGTFIDPADQKNTRWVAPTSGGVYTFKIVVSNDYKSAERTSTVTVIEPTIPVIEILAPEDGDYFVQGQEISIQAEARHSNGINKVILYIEDSFIQELSGQSGNNYNFNFVPDTSYLGETKIAIEGIANFTAAVGTDSISVFIEGILPKTVSDNSD